MFHLLKFFHLKFLNYCLFKILMFHLLQPFLFHLNFLIYFFLLLFLLSFIFLLSCSWRKRSILSLSLSLSLSLQFCFSFGGFFYCFNHFSTNGAFCHYWFNCHITFVSFFGKFVSTFMHIYVFRYSNFRSQVCFLYPIGLIWFGLKMNYFAS